MALVDARSKLGNKERLGWSRWSGRKNQTILGDAGCGSGRRSGGIGLSELTRVDKSGVDIYIN